MNPSSATPWTIRVAAPCPANWDEMEGDQRARFCRHCQKNVYNLSALTAEAAADLIRAKEGRLCGRFFQRADGTLLHANDCRVGLAARQWQRVRRWTGAAASVVLLIFGAQRVSAAEPTADGKKPAATPVDEGRMTLGKICVVPSPSPTPPPSPSPTPKK